MSDSDLATVAMAAFDQVVAATPGFRARAGQREMAQRIADALHDVSLGDQTDPQCAVTVIQAGTGVGKSAAYLSTTVALALERKTRVVVSTATVALQEQLMTKDLPALAAVLDTSFVYALAKGRGRYVCKLKLERLVGHVGEDAAELFEGDDEVNTTQAPSAFQPQRGAVWQDPMERRVALYETLASALAKGKWDGDRDSLAEQPDARDWSTVAAERHTCTARHCPRFSSCSYYQARMQLAQAQVIVANHDLVLASLGMKALPELDNCLVVFDEGHHLPAVALDQFSSAMDLTGLRWLDKLPKILIEVADKTGFVLVQDVATLAQQLKTALLEAGRLAMELVRGVSTGYDTVYRFKDGIVPEAMLEPFKLIHGHAAALSDALEALGTELKA
ncbi:MAG TPA: ATP-dependent DNA helicase DinG, partial [Rhodoferax sp.]|nr:ATP-dependent DNA helicase DinG [Rhodoferax sp.]